MRYFPSSVPCALAQLTTAACYIQLSRLVIGHRRGAYRVRLPDAMCMAVDLGRELSGLLAGTLVDRGSRDLVSLREGAVVDVELQKPMSA
jgi:hypothetical protein